MPEHPPIQSAACVMPQLPTLPLTQQKLRLKGTEQAVSRQTSQVWQPKRSITSVRMLPTIRELVYGNEVSFTTSAESDKVRLPESGIDKDGYTEKFEYDNQYRITKITYIEDGNPHAEEIFSYSGNNMTVVSKELGYPEYDTTNEFVKNGNKITATWKRDNETRIFTISLNDNDVPTTATSTSREGWTDVYTFTIQNGNMTEWTEWTESYTYKYKFDDKKSPFHNCTTPKWFMFWDKHGHGSQNNVIEEDRDGEIFLPTNCC